MKVYVFGAGASQGSQKIENPPNIDLSEKAPLANEIFNEQYLRYADPVALSRTDLQNIRKASAGSVEAWLTSEWDAIGRLKEETSKQAKRTLFGRLTFYTWSLFLSVSQTYSETNGYFIFARKLETQDEPFGLISFNYDTLLDKAVSQIFGQTLDSLDGYFNFRFFKPHGSVNWILLPRLHMVLSDPSIDPREAEFDPRTRFEVAGGRMFNGPPIPFAPKIILPSHRDLRNPELLFKRVDQQYFYPLIFMPLTSKMYSSIDQFGDQIIKKRKGLN